MSTKDELINAKNELKAKKKELVKFRKSNKLKADQVPEDEKLAKTLEKLKGAVEKQEAVLAEIKEKAKAEKGKRGPSTKYDYPMVKDEDSGEEREMTAAEKKKFRAKARAEKKKAEKGEQAPKKEKKEKAPKAKKKKKTEESEEDDD